MLLIDGGRNPLTQNPLTGVDGHALIRNLVESRGAHETRAPGTLGRVMKRGHFFRSSFGGYNVRSHDFRHRCSDFVRMRGVLSLLG